MNVQPQHPLFRAEVMEARRARIDGEIVLTQPIGRRLLTLLLFAIIMVAAAWVTLGQYTRSETARGVLVTDRPSAQVVALRPGQVTSLLVIEGQRVKAGQPVALIQVEQSNEGGGSAANEGLAAIEAQRGLAQQQARLADERAASGRPVDGMILTTSGKVETEVETEVAARVKVVAQLRNN